MSIITPAVLKPRLGMLCSVVQFDSTIQAIIDAAEAAFCLLTKRPYFFDPGSDQTLFLSSPGATSTILLPRPVTAITNVYFDDRGYFGQRSGSFADDALTAGETYFVNRLEASESNPSELKAIYGGFIYGGSANFGGGGEWPAAQGGYKIIGRFGYTAETLPKDVTEYLIRVMTQLWRTRGSGGQQLRRETIGDYAYEVMTGNDQGASGGNSAGAPLDQTNNQTILSRYREPIF